MLNFLYYLVLMLGAAFLIVSIVAPKRLILPNPSKVKNIKEYIKNQRILFLIIGACYTLLGGLLLFKILSLSIGISFLSILPILLLIFNDKINKKCLL